MKKYLSLLFILITVFVLTACSKENTDTNSKEFKENDFEITLTNDFIKIEVPNVKYYFENKEKDIVVFVTSESKQLFQNAGVVFPDDAKGYADFIIKTNKLESEVTKKGDNAHFTYKSTANGKEYYFYAISLKKDDNCWLVRFRCESTKINDYIADFDKWASTIIVK